MVWQVLRLSVFAVCVFIVAASIDALVLLTHRLPLMIDTELRYAFCKFPIARVRVEYVEPDALCMVEVIVASPCVDVRFDISD